MADKAEQTGKKEKSHMPMMAIIGIVLVLNLLIVGKIFMGGKGGSSAASKESQQVGKKMPLEEFLVNLADPGSERYQKTKIALGLSKDADEKKLEEDLAPIKDSVISVLSSSKRDEMSTEEGKQKLKEEIKERINKRLGGHKVVEIYFTAFATQ